MLLTSNKRLALSPGDVFGNLTAICFVGRNNQSKQIWAVQCSCGKFLVVKKGQLFDKKKPRRSCGCLHKPFVPKQRLGGIVKHGMTRTNVYQIWSGLRRRCLSPNNKDYHNYGGRGIRVCERWEEFQNFYADMGEPPPRYTLHRIDNDGDYSPENCVWATVEYQNQHKGSCRMVMLHGEQMSAAQVARALGVKETTFYLWLKTYGSDGAIEKASTYKPRRTTPRLERQAQWPLLT
jgi:hypothetical protein